MGRKEAKMRGSLRSLLLSKPSSTVIPTQKAREEGMGTRPQKTRELEKSDKGKAWIEKKVGPPSL